MKPLLPENTDDREQVKTKPASAVKKETGGPKGPEPTRYGDWEIGGKCVDF